MEAITSGTRISRFALRAKEYLYVAVTRSAGVPRLPEEVADVLTTSLYTEFASVTATGVPLDTPLFAFVEPAGGTIDVATGLAYPAKANRVRRNPKVGLLLEGNGNRGEPVVSVAGFGAVRDADIQANVERYLAETADAPARHLRRDSLVDRPPGRLVLGPHHRRRPRPPTLRGGRMSSIWIRSLRVGARRRGRRSRNLILHPPGPRPRPPAWPTPTDWRPRAHEVLEQRLTGHLTVRDDDGFPLPFRVRDCRPQR